MTIVVILRVVAFQGYSDSDPRAYSVLADNLAYGTLLITEYDGPPVFPLRLGVYAPTAALIRIFGLSEVTLAAYPFLVSILGCLLAYAVSRRLGTPFAGLIGLSALAALPIDIRMASLLLPDSIAAFWANVGIVLACVALTKSDLRQSAFLGVLSGVLFGVSWLCKETVLFLIPFVAILVLVLHRHSRLSVRTTCLVAISVGVIAVLLAEMAFYAKLAGDPLFRLHAMERNYEQAAVWFFDKSSPYYGWESGGYAKALVKRLFFTGPSAMLLSKSMAFVPTVAIIGAAWAAVFRRRSFVLPAIWLISLLVMFNFMTSSFTSYQPLPLFSRYLYPILLPSLVLFGGFLAALLAGDFDSVNGDQPVRTERRFWATVLIIGSCGISALGFANISMSRPEQVERNVATLLRETDVVYTDYRTAANLVFFRTGTLLPSNATTIAWEKEDRTRIPKGAYVLANRDKTDFLRESYKYEIPDYVARPPSTWESIWTYGNAVLYRVGGT
jgi:4-amino-4-deoxy-L-arabinose transferase-like glycosyltransferase